MRWLKLPGVLHNWTSYVGAAIAALAFIAIVFLFVLSSVSGNQAPYAGLVIFVALPTVMLGGLLLVPIGMLTEWRHLRVTGQRSIPRFPVVDLNQPAQRNATVLFAVVSMLVLFLSVFGSFQAYESTESVAFCGATCHLPMEPEYTTYENSPHARVRCVDCHVGPGANWYVKSKLSGLYQVYAVLFDKFPRPIPGTIESLRPAQHTCEQCHWPAKFFGSQQMRRVHYLSDEQNTPWEVNLLIRIGGTEPFGQQGQGIHWHMNIANRIEYIATDPDRQNIPWVRVTDDETGVSTVYTAADGALSDQEIAAAEVRVMDCMDCHNRPSHILLSPQASLDRALQLGEIDASLPFIVKQGIELLKADYPSLPAALHAIRQGLVDYYDAEHPALLASRRADVQRAATALQQIYRQNFFPAMKARWDVYPDNIGHKNFPGCMRCHDGSHQSADGRVVSRECRTCHAIVGQGGPREMKFSMQPEGLPFEHPGDVGDAWEGMQCTDCHAESG
jgi:nitrate/TMAO reductase-like tetraheme cytochrome c subunit